MPTYPRILWVSCFSSGRTGRGFYWILITTLLAACSKSGDDRSRGGGHSQLQPPRGLPEYRESIGQIQGRRDGLRLAYRRARGTAERRQVIEQARKVLVAGIFEGLMPHWYGTPWDFDGISEIPGEGEIACGYFVSTILRDAGLSVERFKLAQQASQNIIRSLTDAEHMRSFHGGDFDDFVSGMGDLGDGLYIIGLDRHVGFIVQVGSASFFIHSDGATHRCVVKEPLASASSLRNSRYRIVGKVSADDALVGCWLSGDRIVTLR